MAKYGIIPDWLMAGYYKALLWKSKNKTDFAPCPFCNGTAIYINFVDPIDIAYCVDCWGSAPIEVWQGRTGRHPMHPENYKAGSWQDAPLIEAQYRETNVKATAGE